MIWRLATAWPYHQENFSILSNKRLVWVIYDPLIWFDQWKKDEGDKANLAWVSGVSGEKGKDGSDKRRDLKERNAWHRCFYWSLPPPKQHDSIPSNQNHFRSLGCQLHVSKSSPKINLTLQFGRGPVFVLLRFRFFFKPPMRSFRTLVI